MGALGTVVAGLAVLGMLSSTACQRDGSTASPPKPTVTYNSTGSLALAKLACHQYPDVVLAPKQDIYDLRYAQSEAAYPSSAELVTVFDTAIVMLKTISMPAFSTLLADVQAVVDSLQQASNYAVPNYRRSDLAAPIRAFTIADLAVSADCSITLGMTQP